MDDDYDDEYDEVDDKSLLEVMSIEKRDRPKVRTHWDCKEIYKLIDLVKNERCIWNSADASYTNKLIRKEAWTRINDAFDDKYDATELHAKWSNLRIQYRMNLRKSKTNWRFLNALAFVGAVNGSTVPPKSSVTSTYNSSIEDSNDSMLDAASISGPTTPASPKAASSVPARSASSVPTRSGSSVPSRPASSVSSRLASSVPSRSATSVYSRPLICRRTLPAASTTTFKRDLEEHHSHSSERDEALANFLLSELRSLNESDANILRCRLQRTLLEFNEERQNNLSTDAVEDIDL